MKKLENVPPPTLEEALKMLEEECVILYDVPFIHKEYRGLTAKITAVCVMHGEFQTSVDRLCKNVVCPCCRDTLSQLKKDHGKESALIYLRNRYSVIKQGGYRNDEHLIIRDFRCIKNKSERIVSKPKLAIGSVSERVLKRIRKIQGDLYEFPSLETEYVDDRSHITGICPVHQQFTTTIKSIIKGRLCSKCGPSLVLLSLEHGEEKAKQLIPEIYSTIKKSGEDVDVLKLFHDLVFRPERRGS